MNSFSPLKAASFKPLSISFPNPWVGHLPFAYWLIGAFKPAIFVELGTHSGNSYFAFCQSVQELHLPTRCYAVDTWQGDIHAGHYDDTIFNAVNLHNEAHYGNFSQLLRTTFDEAVNHFENGSINLLHIDGLHTYEAVKHDFQTWLPKLAPNAIVLFHDITVHREGFGVWQFWSELQEQYKTNLAFSHSNGLGVLSLDHRATQLASWLGAPEILLDEIRDYFTAIGERQLEVFNLNAEQNSLKILMIRSAQLFLRKVLKRSS